MASVRGGTVASGQIRTRIVLPPIGSQHIMLDPDLLGCLAIITRKEKEWPTRDRKERDRPNQRIIKVKEQSSLFNCVLIATKGHAIHF
jgi:hypothetical protein